MCCILILGTPCTFDAATTSLKCNYVHINCVQTAVIPKKDNHPPPLTQIYKFEEYQSQLTCDNKQLSVEIDQESVNVDKCCIKNNFHFCIHTIIENNKKSVWKLVCLVKSVASVHGFLALVDLPEANIRIQMSVVTDEKDDVTIEGIQVITFESPQLAKILADADICISFTDMVVLDVIKQLPHHCWLLLLGELVIKSCNIEVMLEEKEYSLVALKKCQYLQMTLYKKTVFCQDPVVVFANDHTHYKWVEEIKVKLSDLSASPNGRLWVICDKDCDSGIIGLINCLLLEIGGNQIRFVNILFITTLLFYSLSCWGP